MGESWLMCSNRAGLEAFTELQKANMMAEFAVGLAKKEMEQGPSVLSQGRRQEVMETLRGGATDSHPIIGSLKLFSSRSQSVARHVKLPPRRHEELPPPWITEERANERGTNHSKPIVE